MLSTVVLAAALVLAPREPVRHFIAANPWNSWTPENVERWLVEPESAHLRATPVAGGLALHPLAPAGPSVPSLTEAHAAVQRGDLRAAATEYTRFADGHDGPIALAARFNAAAIAVGLGEYRPARWALDPLTITHGPSVRTAAALFWSAADLMENDAARVWHARMYLRGFAGKGGRDLQAHAELIVGRDLWRRACPVVDLDGTCGVIAHVDWYHGCGRSEGERMIVIERDATLAAAAQRHITAALRHAELRGQLSPQRAQARHDVASQARWLLAEPHFEALLRDLDLPGEMLPDWQDDESSALHRLTTADQRDERLSEEFRNYRSIRRRIEKSDALMRRYEAVIADRSPSTVHAAFLRSAQGLHDKALQLSHVSWPEPVGSFCSDDRVASLLAEAEPYLGACERIARATGNIDVWAERCIARRSDPAPELHASSTRPIPVSFPVQLAE